MARVYTFSPKRRSPEQAKLLLMESHLKSNIVVLAAMRDKLLKLQKEFDKLKRNHLKLVGHGNNSDKDK